MYQSCEHKGWKRSKAFKLLNNLRGSIEARVPHVPNSVATNAAYIPQRAGWEIDDRTELMWPLVEEYGRWAAVDPRTMKAA
jgi:hypothetical protein